MTLKDLPELEFVSTDADAIEYGVDCVACARFDCPAVVVTKRRRELFIISIRHCLPHIHLLERGVIP